MDYFIGVSGQRSGPFPETEVREKLKRGELPADALCWTQGWGEWRSVSVVFAEANAMLASAGAPAVPPAIAPSPVSAPVPTGTSGLAIASLVCGVLGVVTLFLSLPAVICGHLALSRIGRAGGAVAGRGLATAGLVLGYGVMVMGLLVLPAIIIPTVGKVRETAKRTMDASSLREIGKASLIYAFDHHNALPQVDSVTAYAAALARDGGLADASVWIAGEERDLAVNRGVVQVLDSSRAGVDPAFARARLAFAVVARGIQDTHPSTTPIAWTRGLRPDGTWSPDSPYGGDGGHIIFLGGNVQFYRSLAGGELLRFDGQGKTSDIREALPPGAVIAEPPQR